MRLLSGLKWGILWMSAVCFVAEGYGIAGELLLVVGRPNVELGIQEGPLLSDDDDDDGRVFVETQEVFWRVANRVVIGGYQNAQQQGNALGLLLQMVVNNWTYDDLRETAEAAFTRIFIHGNPWRGALHQLMDSIQEEYRDGTSHADRLMRWMLAAMCGYGTPVPYHDVRLRAHELLLRTGPVPAEFISVFDASNEAEEQERIYKIQLAYIIQAIQEHIERLRGGLYPDVWEQLDALDAMFDLAVGTPYVRDDMALIETVTTGYDRLLRHVLFHEEALLEFIEGLMNIDNPGEASRNLIQCILVLLCEKDTLVLYSSVHKKAYQGLQKMNAVPPGFVGAN